MEQQEDKKYRKIRIKIADVYKDIDSRTYKYAEASTVEAPKQKDAMQSDVSDNLDGHILARNVELRDAKLRQLFSEWLKENDTEIIIETNTLYANTQEYLDYEMYVPVELKDAMLRSVATFMHTYLVCGALFDWYGKGMGDKQAAIYQAELDDIETNITNTLIPSTVIIPPLNPWGRPISKY